MAPTAAYAETTGPASADAETTGVAPTSVEATAFPALPIGPPLGLGGLPFETAQWELPEGSLLALFTDGLVHSRTRDVDASLALVSDTLREASESSMSPEEVCDQLLTTVFPGRPADDVALLVARTPARIGVERSAPSPITADAIHATALRRL
ncbi:SpoIIE family protein phosphatase [Streptomyces sp. NPDC054847]